MRRLKLIQGLSYAVRGFSCVRGVPFDADDNIAKKLLSTGRFEELQGVDANDGGMDDKEFDGIMKMFGNESEAEPEDTNNEPASFGFIQDNAEPPTQFPADQDNAEPPQTVPEQSTVPELSADKIAKLKKPELEALAEEKNIDISDCSNNEERAAKICGALGLASMVQMGLED